MDLEGTMRSWPLKDSMRLYKVYWQAGCLETSAWRADEAHVFLEVRVCLEGLRSWFTLIWLMRSVHWSRMLLCSCCHKEEEEHCAFFFCDHDSCWSGWCDLLTIHECIVAARLAVRDTPYVVLTSWCGNRFMRSLLYELFRFDIWGSATNQNSI